MNEFDVTINTSVPNKFSARTWGDYYFACNLARAFERQGLSSRISFLGETVHSFGRILNIDLLGLPRPPESYRLTKALNVAWIISHPDLMLSIDLDAYDHLFVASNQFIETHLSKYSTSALLQCSPREFWLENISERDRRPIMIGNARGLDSRFILDLAYESHTKIRLVGSGWENTKYSQICEPVIPHLKLPSYYGRHTSVLSDHWEDMTRHGFLSNRIFDALACGTPVIGETVQNLPQDFLKFYFACKTVNDFLNAIESSEKLCCNSNEIFQMSQLIREEHSFDNRTVQIMEQLDIAARTLK
jgi:hypothetical protein